ETHVKRLGERDADLPGRAAQDRSRLGGRRHEPGVRERRGGCRNHEDGCEHGRPTDPPDQEPSLAATSPVGPPLVGDEEGGGARCHTGGQPFLAYSRRSGANSLNHAPVIIRPPIAINTTPPVISTPRAWRRN